jgi:drug/metabolite transporter (DMT)-like permease
MWDEQISSLRCLGAGCALDLLVRHLRPLGNCTWRRIAFYRVFLTEIALAVAYAFQRRRIAFQARVLWLDMASGVFLGANLALFNSAVLRTSVANVSLLCNNTSVFVGVLSWVLMRRRPRRDYWVGLGLATFRSVLIIRIDSVRHITLGTADLMSLRSLSVAISIPGGKRHLSLCV